VRAKKLAGITGGVRFHDPRHSVGCRLVSRGLDIIVVRDVLGHASIVTTQRYARASTKARQAITSALSVRGDEQEVERAMTGDTNCATYSASVQSPTDSMLRITPRQRFLPPAPRGHLWFVREVSYTSSPHRVHLPRVPQLRSLMIACAHALRIAQ
jgi:hypothetical protein